MAWQHFVNYLNHPYVHPEIAELERLYTMTERLPESHTRSTIWHVILPHDTVTILSEPELLDFVEGLEPEHFTVIQSNIEQEQYDRILQMRQRRG